MSDKWMEGFVFGMLIGSFLLPVIGWLLVKALNIKDRS